MGSGQSMQLPDGHILIDPDLLKPVMDGLDLLMTHRRHNGTGVRPEVTELRNKCRSGLARYAIQRRAESVSGPAVRTPTDQAALSNLGERRLLNAEQVAALVGVKTAH